MKREKLATILGVGLLASCGGCSGKNYTYHPSVEDVERLKEHSGLIVAIEGLQPLSGTLCTDLAKKLANENGLVLSASSGDWGCHKEIVKKAYELKNDIYFIGFSAGTEEVWHLTEFCENEDIKIESVVYLDPTHLNHSLRNGSRDISGNVESVFAFLGSESGFFGGRLPTQNNLENSETKLETKILKGKSHLEVPNSREVYITLREKIEANHLRYLAAVE